MALSPQADLATEPRWSGSLARSVRIPSACATWSRHTWLEVRTAGRASGLTHRGVATIVKHWVSYGASVDGFDGHNYYGRFSRFPAGRFADHVTPFRKRVRLRVAGVMPFLQHSRGLALDGQPVEAVGAGYNAQLLSGLLRGRYGFRGVVVSDWGITRDCELGVPHGRSTANAR
ncbi:MAG: glycoside hydrolase family 3 N-terminal domain-containing protein [Gemmatimonadaceae bacterium]